MAETPPMCVRATPALRASIDEAAHIRGWTRTTWILWAIGKGLEHDRQIFGLTDDDHARVEQRRTASMERTRRWRKTRRPAS